jgi:hypothetical protein
MREGYRYYQRWSFWTTKTRRRPRRSVTVSVSTDRCAACTRHPDAIALDLTVEISAVLVLLEEGVEGVEEGHVALVEHALFDHLIRPPQH